MSSEIYYKRAYIKVGEFYIPIVQHGASNCFELIWTSRGTREVAERNWGSLWYKDRSKVLITKDELQQLANDLGGKAEGGGIWKSRENTFEPDEFRNWVLNGARSACTVEEYVEAGNSLYVFEFGRDNSVEHSFKTEKELLQILEKLKEKNSQSVSVGFGSTDLHTPRRLRRHRPTGAEIRKAQHKIQESDHYVLLDDTGNAFCNLTKHGYRYVPDANRIHVRRFKTLKEAEKYLKKNGKRININGANFKPELIHAACAAL